MSSELYRVMPAPPSTLPSKLEGRQLRLLQEIALPYEKSGTWPIWQYVAYRMSRAKLDAREILASLPRVGVTGAMGPSYGFTVGYDGRMLADADKIQLTVAAALPLTKLRPIIADPFLRTLHHMIELLDSAELSPTEVTETWLDSRELARAIPSLKPEFIAALPEILSGEPSTWSGSSSGPNPPADLDWRKEIRQPAQQYASVTTLENYVETVCQITAEQASEQKRMLRAAALSPLPAADSWALPAQSSHGAARPPSDAHLAAQTYVKETLISELEALDATELGTRKLVDLLNELNFNFAHGKPLACNCLLRAVIDHVPPGFGVGTFAQVISNVPWPRTDRKYLDRLQEFRNQGDDVMHRQMGSRRSHIDMSDVPAPAALNAVLDGLIAKLKDRKSAAPAKP